MQSVTGSIRIRTIHNMVKVKILIGLHLEAFFLQIKDVYFAEFLHMRVIVQYDASLARTLNGFIHLARNFKIKVIDILWMTLATFLKNFKITTDDLLLSGAELGFSRGVGQLFKKNLEILLIDLKSKLIAEALSNPYKDHKISVP